MNIAANFKNIEQQIASINPQAKLMVVGKNHSAEHINQAIQVGAKIIGENKLQEAQQKLPDLLECEKHFIGHLQRNKVKDVVKYFDCIQSVDSLRLALKINQEAENIKKVMPVMIQINISYDDNKYGVVPKNLDALLPSIAQLKNIKLIGFMTITALESEAKIREDYKEMKHIFDKYKNKYSLTELSMGMSQDYKIALEEGATMVRIGTAIFSK